MQSTVKKDWTARYLIVEPIQPDKKWRVEDTQQNHEKFTLTEFDTNTFSSRQKELKTLVNLKHSQIPKFQIHEQDESWLILQSDIEGQSYEELLQQKLSHNQPLFSEYEVVQLLNQILPVLSYLHSHNVTHRNISASSLILREQDQMPILVNFGVMQNTDTKKSDPIKEDLRDLAITALRLLTGKEWENENWDEALKKLSDQRREVLKKMLESSSISANSLLQELNINSVFQNYFSPELPALLKYLTAGFVGLLFLALIIPNLSSRTPTPTPVPKEEPKFNCPSGSDIIAIACTIDVKLIHTEAANFNGGKLTVKFTENPTPTDRLKIDIQSNNPELINLKDSDVIYRNKNIGSFQGGIGSTPLTITFNANADIDAVQTIINSIVYQNLAKNPSQGNRTIEFKLTDGNGLISNSVKKVIGIYPVNLSPVLTVPGQQTVKENSPLTISGISVKDSDAGNDKITVNLEVENGTITIKDDIKDGLPLINGQQPGTYSFSGNINQINNTLKAIVYKGNQNFYGLDHLNIVVEDSGKTRRSGVEEIIWPPGALDARNDTKTVPIRIEVVNTPPILVDSTTLLSPPPPSPPPKTTEQSPSIPTQSDNNPSQLSRQAAVDLIQAWLEAKKEAYGRNHNDQVIYKYTTGRYLDKNIGTLTELKTKGQHYTYEKPTVQPLSQLYQQGNQPTLDVKIDEYQTYYNKKGRIMPINTAG